MQIINKKDIIEKVAKEEDMRADRVEAVADAVFESIVIAMVDLKSVKWTNFATFEPRKHAAREGKSPKNGVKYKSPKFARPWLRFSRKVKKRMKDSQRFKELVESGHL